MLPDISRVPACDCAWCVSACKRRPGWFLPGEMEKAADALGMSALDFFRKHCAIDFHTEDGEPKVFVIAPRLHGEEGGAFYPFTPTGRCALLTEDERCSIHEHKPFECRACHHDKNISFPDIHQHIVPEWDTPEHQKQVHDLLSACGNGDEEVPTPGIFDLVSLIFNAKGF